MKFLHFSRLLFLISFLCFISCKKDYQQIKVSDATEAKVNTWLNEQNLRLTTLELLKNGLDYSHLHYETLANNLKLLVIPRHLESGGPLDKASSKSLLLYENADGTIRTGCMLEYTPDDANVDGEISTHSIAKVFNQEHPQLSGNLTFKNLNSQSIGALQYSNGKLRSVSNMKGIHKNEASTIVQDPIGPAPTCTEWYLVTTFYYEDGTTSQETRYLYTTCESGGEGGGGLASSEYLEASSIADDNHISCQSFKFINGGSTNAQEAGLKNITFQVGDNSIPPTVISITLPGPFYVSVPSKIFDAREVTANEAAAKAAKALDQAGIALVAKYRDQKYTLGQIAAIPVSQLSLQLKNLWIINLAAQFPGSYTNVKLGGGPDFFSTVTKEPIYNSPLEIIYNRISGDGCY